jgi:hypothetical protein
MKIEKTKIILSFPTDSIFLFAGLAYQGKDIVFRLCIDYAYIQNKNKISCFAPLCVSLLV